MQHQPTTPRRRWVQRTLAAAIAGAILIVPAGVAMAGEAQSGIPQGNAYAYGKPAAPGQLKKAPPAPPADVTPPQVQIVSAPSAISLSGGATGEVVARISDDLGVAGAQLDLSSYWGPQTVALSQQPDGLWHGTITAQVRDAGFVIYWKVTAHDAAGNTSSVDGQPFQVLN